MSGVTNTNILFQVLQARVRTGGKSSAIMTAEDTGLLLRAHITVNRIRSLTILEPGVPGGARYESAGALLRRLLSQ